MKGRLKELFARAAECRKNDSYSPNGALLAVGVALFLVTVFCGTSLWIPASRIENLYLRSVALSCADALSAFAGSTGFDAAMPVLRNGFIASAGLSGDGAWDTRYYNKRVALTAGPDSSPNRAPLSAAEPDGSGRHVSPAVPVMAAPALLSQAPFAAGTSMVHSRENPLRVYMFGDSQVFSLGSGLSRLAGKDSPISVDFVPIHSSGFVRGDYFNWPTKLEDTFRASSYQAAVMMLGMNDWQSFWNSKGEIMRKGTPEWEAAYKEKCRRIIDLTLAAVPRLYWIGLPAVRNQAYDANLAYIDSVQASLAAEYSPDVLVRVPLRETIPGAGKPYADSIDFGDGKTLRVMGADGCHFTVEGGQIAMKPLFDLLATDYFFSEVPVAHLPG